MLESTQTPMPQPTHLRKGGRAIGEQLPVDLKHSRETLDALKRDYIFLSDDASIAACIAETGAVAKLLAEAVPQLRNAFGPEALFNLEALHGDEDRLLQVIVQLAHGVDEARQHMQDFERRWWLDNCARSDAALVFDFELADAVRLA